MDLCCLRLLVLLSNLIQEIKTTPAICKPGFLLVNFFSGSVLKRVFLTALVVVQHSQLALQMLHLWVFSGGFEGQMPQSGPQKQVGDQQDDRQSVHVFRVNP